jgi:methyl-accepting chemotaxis protein
MKILAKLLLSFLAVAVLCAIVGTVGLDQLEKTKESISLLSGETIPKLYYVNTIDKQFRDIKTSVRSISNPLGIDDPEFFDRQIANIEKARSVYGESRKKYEEYPMVPEEKRLYEIIIKNIETAAAYNNSVVALCKEARAAKPEDRAPIYQRIYAKISGPERLAMDNLVASFEDLEKFDQQYYGVDIPKETFKTVTMGRIMVLVITVFAFIAALAFGIVQGLMISGRLKKTVHVLDKIAHGDLSERIEIKTTDEFLQLAESLNGVEDNIAALVGDTDTLVQSALDGRLSVRADPEKHKGDYRKVIVGINNTLDAVVGPLTVAANYIDRISKGDMPEKIAENYNGDFNKIKDNLNIAIDSIQNLISDTMLLSDAAVSGALQTRADASKHQGDYRKIIDGINTTLDLVITPINEIIEILKHLADGDMTLRMAGDYKGDFDVLKTALNESLDAINDTLGQINNAVDQVAEGAVQVSQASQSLSQGATEQASSLEEITSSTTEISSQTRQNTDNALKMNSLAKEAQENAEKGNNQMKELVAAMTDINRSAEEINKVVKTIDDISFQINLLALNANVEAARAGKYGKGFAVVAEEVRNLAVRSANSVKETTRMVEEVIGNIQRGNSLVEGSASQLDEIVGGSSQVSVLAEEVATAGREQTQGLEQISLGLNQIDQVTQSNTASAEESASASEELSSQAQQVKAMLARFRLKGGDHRQSDAAGDRAERENFASRSQKRSIQQASVAQAKKPVAQAPRFKTPALNPADVISLDDSNFGKF